MAQPVCYAMHAGTAPARRHIGHSKIAPYGTFRTGAGGPGAGQPGAARL